MSPRYNSKENKVDDLTKRLIRDIHANTEKPLPNKPPRYINWGVGVNKTLRENVMKITAVEVNAVTMMCGFHKET